METLSSNTQLKHLNENGEFSGYASVSNIKNLNGYFINSGAFTNINQDFAAGKKPKILWQHEWNNPIGILKEISEDDYGLFIKAQLLLDIPKGKEAYLLLKNKAIEGLSIGFEIKNRIFKDGEEYVTEAILNEISIVTFPGNEKATVIHTNSYIEKKEKEMTQKNETKDDEVERKESKIMFSKEQVEELKKKMQDEMRNELKQTFLFSKEIEAQLGGDWAEFASDREALSKKFFALFGISEKEDTLATAVKVLKKSKELFSKVSVNMDDLKKATSSDDIPKEKIEEFLKLKSENAKHLYQRRGA